MLLGPIPNKVKTGVVDVSQIVDVDMQFGPRRYLFQCFRKTWQTRRSQEGCRTEQLQMTDLSIGFKIQFQMSKPVDQLYNRQDYSNDDTDQ